ncbi:MAG: DUF692 domain-containing protein [Deltaproteobacteria bacterium]|nr:DUF692 domain-containing protein [Nannocystaceae bacterium]
MSSGLHGVGIGLRREHYDVIGTCTRGIDFLEIIPENFVGHGGYPRRVLRECAQRWPIAVHGVSASVGGPDPFDLEYLAGLRSLLDELGAAVYSDHLCYAAIDGVSFFDLLPLPFSSSTARHAAARIRELQDRLERRIAVENIAYYATMPGTTVSEGAFITEVLERADCGLLLDLNNVYVNARNHRRDPFECLHALPLARTLQIHLAGFCAEGERLIDDHGAAVDDSVWELYRSVIAQLGPVPTLIEWDNAIPALDRLLDEADRARAIQAAYDRTQQSGAA